MGTLLTVFLFGVVTGAILYYFKDQISAWIDRTFTRNEQAVVKKIQDEVKKV